MMSVHRVQQSLLEWVATGALPPRTGDEHVVSENPISVTLRRAGTKRVGGGLVHAESWLEFAVTGLLEFDSRISMYREQAMVIPWVDERGRKRRYTPDFLVRTVLGPGGKSMNSSVVEVKPYKVVVSTWPKLRPKVRAIQEMLSAIGVKYKIITERNFTPSLVKNVNFLLGYDDKRMAPQGTLPAAAARRFRAVQEVITEHKTTTPRRVLDELSKEADERRFLIPFIWHRLRYQYASADLLEPLTMDSEIWDSFEVRRLPDWQEPKHDWYR